MVTAPDEPSAKQWAQLEHMARAAAQRAYAPYSRFIVGAAVLADNGNIYPGCNVENASYGLTTCAERNALTSARSQHGITTILAVCIYTPTSHPTAPCGACRQVLNEFGPNMRVRAICDGPTRLDTTLSELLPEAFVPHHLASSVPRS